MLLSDFGQFWLLLFICFCKILLPFSIFVWFFFFPGIWFYFWVLGLDFSFFFLVVLFGFWTPSSFFVYLGFVLQRFALLFVWFCGFLHFGFSAFIIIIIIEVVSTFHCVSCEISRLKDVIIFFSSAFAYGFWNGLQRCLLFITFLDSKTQNIYYFS